MNVWNLSTNSYYFTGLFSDGSDQSLCLAPDSGCQVGGAIIGGTTYQDSFTTNWVLVNSDLSGAVVHGSPGVSSIYLSGFFDVAGLTAVLACVWFIRRAMGMGGTRGYSSE
jgi:hypothetical protein